MVTSGQKGPTGVCVVKKSELAFEIASWKSAPALTCGKAVIVKLPPLLPADALFLAKIHAKTGMGPGLSAGPAQASFCLNDSV